MARCVLLVCLVLAAQPCIAQDVDVCVSVDKTQSSTWVDKDHKTLRFSLRFRILKWVPFTRITLRWPNPVKIEHVNEALLIGQPGELFPPSFSHLGVASLIVACSDVHSLLVELGKEQHSSHSFQISGTGSEDMEPTIECT